MQPPTVRRWSGSPAETKTKPNYGNPVEAELLRSTKDRWQPRAATLDLAESPIHPVPPDATTDATMDPLAALVGKELRPVLKDAQVVTLAGIRILDSKGTVIASTREELGKSLADREKVRRALQGEYNSVLRRRLSDEPQPAMKSISRGTSVRVFTTTPIIVNDRVVGVAVLSRTPRNIVQALYGQRYPLIIGGVVLIFVVALITLFTSLTISRPIQGVVSQAKQAADGEIGSVTPLDRPVTREVDELSRAVSTMAKTLEDRADYIRTFASHISHEFKTPLTAIQGAIELLRDHAARMSSEDRERFLSNIDTDAKRLERLVNQLLELARADMTQPGADERANVSTAIESVRTRYDENELIIAVQNPTEDLSVGMAEETLESTLQLHKKRSWGDETPVFAVLFRWHRVFPGFHRG